MTRTLFSPRLPMLAVTAALALGLAACDDSDGSGGEAAGGGASPSGQAAAVPVLTGSPAQQVEQAFTALQANFRAGNVQEVCAQMTERGQSIALAAAGGRYQTCVEMMSAFHEQYGNTSFRPSFVKARIGGGRAIATVKVGQTTSKGYRFAKQDGTWKLDQGLE